MIIYYLQNTSIETWGYVAQLSSRGWADPVPDPILPEKILKYSQEWSPGPSGWQSDVLTMIMWLITQYGTVVCLHKYEMCQAAMLRNVEWSC